MNTDTETEDPRPDKTEFRETLKYTREKGTEELVALGVPRDKAGYIISSTMSSAGMAMFLFMSRLLTRIDEKRKAEKCQS